ncbi:hypothetical protein MKX01_019834, partial [Papaver californicum]
MFESFWKPYLYIAKDSTSGLERPLYFVVGDVLVPAECVAQYEYQGLLLLNLLGEVEFFFARLTFPKTKKSHIKTELEEKVVKPLVTNEKDYKKLIRKLKKCYNKKTHSGRG